MLLNDRGCGRMLRGELRRFDTRRIPRNSDRPNVCLGPCPLIRGPTSDSADISSRLRWQCPLLGKPILDALGASIVGGRRQPEIAKLSAQLTQELSRFRQRLDRVERVEQKAFSGGRRHELRDALSPPAAACQWSDRMGHQAAFLPDEPSKNSTGRPLSAAADWIIGQSDSVV